MTTAMARPSSAGWGRSGPRTWSCHPAGKGTVPAVVWRLEEHCLPELVVAAVARDPDVSHAAAAPGRFPGRFADARRPAHLRLAWPQLMTERAAPWFVLEQRNGHLNDHALTSRYESTITVAGSGSGPGVVICTGCEHHGDAQVPLNMSPDAASCHKGLQDRQPKILSITSAPWV